MFKVFCPKCSAETKNTKPGYKQCEKCIATFEVTTRWTVRDITPMPKLHILRFVLLLPLFVVMFLADVYENSFIYIYQTEILGLLIAIMTATTFIEFFMHGHILVPRSSKAEYIRYDQHPYYFIFVSIGYICFFILGVVKFVNI